MNNKKKYFCSMKFMKFFFLFLICTLPIFLFAQEKNKNKKEEESKKNEEQGVDFYIAGGVYFGNKYHAAYYNGTPENIHTLEYIFTNTSWKQSIDNLITSQHHYITSNDPRIAIKEYPAKMKYTPAFGIQLGTKYRFNKSWGIALTYSFARLKAKDVFSVKYNKSTPGNDNPDYLLYEIIGEENRSFFDLSAVYIIPTSSIAKPFFELSGQFNFVRVKSLNAIIEGQKFSLLNIYGNQTYVANTSMQTFDTKYGGAGFGFSGAFGIKLAFNKVVSIDPLFYISVTKLGLEKYSNFAINYGLMVRIIMNDSFFAK